MTGWQRHGQRRADALRGGAAGTDFVRSLVDADGTVGVLIVTELHIHQFGRRDRQIGRVLVPAANVGGDDEIVHVRVVA